jgi:hypothetical protein
MGKVLLAWLVCLHDRVRLNIEEDLVFDDV